MNKLLTIAIATYNSDEFIEECLLSIINQVDVNKLEIIIIDGNSNDNTVNIIKKYEYCIDYWVSEKDNGIYDAMNKSINKANGEYIFFMGSDDTLIKNSVFKLLSIFELNRNELIALPVAIDSIETLAYPNIDFPVPIVHHQGAIFNLKKLKELGLYSDKYKVHSDFDLMNKYIKNHGIKYIDNPICLFRKGGASTSGANALQSMKELLHIYFSNGGRFLSIKWVMFIVRPLYYYISSMFSK